MVSSQTSSSGRAEIISGIRNWERRTFGEPSDVVREIRSYGGRGISSGEYQKRVREQLAKQQQEAQKEAQEKSRQAELKRQAELERQRLIEKQRADAQARKEQLVKEREFVKEFKQMNQAERSQAIKEQVEYARATRYQKQLEGGARLTPQAEATRTSIFGQQISQPSFEPTQTKTTPTFDSDIRKLDFNIPTGGMGTNIFAPSGTAEDIVPSFDVSKETKTTSAIGAGAVDSITASDHTGFKLSGIGKPARPESTFIERVKDVPGEFVGTLRDVFVEAKPGEIFTGIGSGFGLFDVGYGATKAEEVIAPLPFQTRGTQLDPGFSVTPTTLGEKQATDIIVSDYAVKNIVSDVSSKYQGKVDTGELTVTQAIAEANKELTAELSSSHLTSLTAEARRDLSIKKKVSDITIPAATVGSFIVAPQVAGGIFGLDQFAKATQSFGVAGSAIRFPGGPEIDDKYIPFTKEERQKAFGMGLLHLGLGSVALGGVTGSIAKQVDVEGLKFLEQRIKLTGGKRVKTPEGTIDVITGKSKTGSGMFKFDATLLTKSTGETSITLGKGTSTLDFFSFASGKQIPTTITQFSVGAKGAGIAGSPIKQWKSVLGIGGIVPESQITFTTSMGGVRLSPRYSPIRITTKGRVFDFKFKRFDGSKKTFEFASLGKETPTTFTFMSGKQTSIIKTSKDVGSVSLENSLIRISKDARGFGLFTKDTTGASQKFIKAKGFKITETKVIGGTFKTGDVGQLEIIDITKLGKGTGVSSNILRGSGRKSSQTFIQSLKPTFTATPTTFGEQITKTSLKPTFTATPTTFGEQITKTSIDLAKPTSEGAIMFAGTGAGVSSIVQQTKQTGGLRLDLTDKLKVKELTKLGSGLSLTTKQKEKQKAGEVSKISTNLISKVNQKQNILQRQQQRQKQKTKQKTKTQLSFRTSTTGFNIPGIIGGGILPPFAFLSLKKAKSKGKKRKAKPRKPPKRSPSLLAIGRGIFAPTRSVGEMSGLIVRPIIRKSKLKRRKK